MFPRHDSSGQRRKSELTVIGFFGMTRIWTGACGLTSVNASARSSSNTTFAGISLRIILPNILHRRGGQAVSKRPSSPYSCGRQGARDHPEWAARVASWGSGRRLCGCNLVRRHRTSGTHDGQRRGGGELQRDGAAAATAMQRQPALATTCTTCSRDNLHFLHLLWMLALHPSLSLHARWGWLMRLTQHPPVTQLSRELL